MSKNSIFAAAVVAGLALGSTGCKDDVVRKKRLDGTWNVDQFVVGGFNIVATSASSSIASRFIFDKDGDFEQRFDITYTDNGTTYSYTYTTTGSWEDADGDLRLNYTPATDGSIFEYASPANYFAYSYNNFEETYDIIELTKDRLEMETTINNSLVKIVATKE